MKRRQWMQSMMGSLLAAEAAWAKPEKSIKKGFCCMNAADAKKLEALWTYNWGATGKSEPGLEFVPMIKGTPHFRPGLFEGVKKLAESKTVTCLLGYNEPERKDQGNMTVAAALELWPKLEEIGLPLGSPAPSSDGGGMRWLDEFMEAAKKKKLRIDFLALHWYRSSSSADFEGWLKEMNRKYRLPIWVTEFNAASTDERTCARFLKDVTQAMDRMKFLQRYAYFTPNPGRAGAMFQADGSLTELGEFYRSV
jgi:hypothetical protein